jgi:colicin import membrane protein
MTDFFRQHVAYLGGAVLLHLLFAAIVGVAMLRIVSDAPPPMLAIDAVLVDSSVIRQASRGQKEQEREAAAREKLERDRREKEAQAQREAEQQAEAERQQQAKEKQQQEEVQRQKELDAKVQREKTEVIERERKAADEKQRQAAAEKERQADAERKKVAEIERKQKEAEDRRRAESEQRAQASRESELKRALEEEQGRDQAANAGLLNQYIAAIEQKVVRNWNRPLSTQTGLECQVKVVQAPGGTVLSVQVGTCNGDAAVKRSIEDAVMKSSPLPAPPDVRLFERNLVFIFKPKD